MSYFIIHNNLAHTANFMLAIYLFIFHKKGNHKPIKSSFSCKSLIKTSVRFGTLETFSLISAAVSMDNSQNKTKLANSGLFHSNNSCQKLFSSTVGEPCVCTDFLGVLEELNSWGLMRSENYIMYGEVFSG